MAKTTEELMKPRYKVIAIYPGSKVNVGDILIKHVFPETGNYCYVTNPDILLLGDNMRADDVEKYPHLFEPLEWWEYRDEKDMPDYVEINGKVFRVGMWAQDGIGGWIVNNISDHIHSSALDLSIAWHFSANVSEPATESDYSTYLQSQQKNKV